MQTFLPYPDFTKSVSVLDWRRLNKQRVEAKQLLDVISPNYPHMGWRNHPAAKMWRGYPEALGLYLNTCIKEWIRRGYNNTMSLVSVSTNIVFPVWLGNKDFHASHRSNLLRKDEGWYSQFGWTEPNNLPYIWPT